METAASFINIYTRRQFGIRSQVNATHRSDCKCLPKSQLRLTESFGFQPVIPSLFLHSSLLSSEDRMHFVEIITSEASRKMSLKDCLVFTAGDTICCRASKQSSEIDMGRHCKWIKLFDSLIPFIMRKSRLHRPQEICEISRV